MNLYECLEEYKEITLGLIEKIKADDLELDELINKRGRMVDNLKEMNFSSQEFKEIIDALGIRNIEDTLETLLKSEKVKAKNRIDLLRKSRKATKNYSNYFGNQNFFTARSK